MAKELWGLNSWFNEGEQRGYIVLLKDELEGRKRGKGTSAVKNIGKEAHQADMAFYEDEARSQAEKGGLKGKEIDVYVKFVSPTARQEDKEEWKNKKNDWEKFDGRLPDDVRRRIKANVEAMNKSEKFLLQEMAKETAPDKKEDSRDMEWMDEMIGLCDKMIDLIGKQDPSFKNNKLRNNKKK